MTTTTDGAELWEPAVTTAGWSAGPPTAPGRYWLWRPAYGVPEPVRVFADPAVWFAGPAGWGRPASGDWWIGPLAGPADGLPLPLP